MRPTVKPTLVVVDMQTGFPAANNHATIKAVAEEIELAMLLGHAIVFVECISELNNYGSTLAVLTDMTIGYDQVAVVQKRGNCGAASVANACRKHGYEQEVFRVCGVNFFACVKATVEGLRREFPDCRTDVVVSACNQPYGHMAVTAKELAAMEGVSIC